MTFRVPRRRSETLPAARLRHHRRSAAERLAYVGVIAISLALAWALASVT
jgi:hypothetical protein